MGGLTATTAVNNSVILCIVNTCTVTAKAEQKARRIFRLLLDKYPCACVLVTGCYAELDKTLIAAIDSRIALLGGRDKDLLADLPVFLKSLLANQTSATQSPTAFLPTPDWAARLSAQLLEFFAQSQSLLQKQLPNVSENRFFRLSTDTFLQHSRSSIKIQDGCNNRCTYCRICFARGTSVSLEPQKVLERVLQLEKANHHEVVLTGINLSQYKSENSSLAQLLDFLLAHTTQIAFRVSSLHPQSVNDELCAVLAHDRIRPHFHLSVQSGSDTVLFAMARPYKALQVTQAVQKLRAIKINPFIACDIIAGFPGETTEDFEATLALCRTNNFAWIHAFPFSPRPGTAAYEMNPQLAQEVCAQRAKQLTALAIEQKKAYIQTCIGKEYTGIVEKYRTGNIRVVSENFLHVQVDSTSVLGNLKTLGGTKVQLRIDGVNKKHLKIGESEAFGSIREKNQ